MAQCAPIQQLNSLKHALEAGQSPIMRRVFGVLFPFGPGANSGEYLNTGTTIPSLTYALALDEALCSGWIDGRRNSLDATTFRQHFTPRRVRSLWSKRNVDLVAGLIAAGRMRPRGFAEIERAIADFGRRARDGSLKLEELSGGTFSITNCGVYGSLMSTPILNPPQSGILGMHKIQDRPMVVGGKVEVRPMMYLALSYDHRIVDGKEAVSFLVRVKEGVEDPRRLMLDI